MILIASNSDLVLSLIRLVQYLVLFAVVKITLVIEDAYQFL